MSGRPGTVRAIHEVGLDRPRDPREVRKRPDFHALVDRIWSDISA
jgi:NitT/TauT family transport system ATP-binding protein